MKILNLTEREAEPIQVRTGLYEPKPEDKKAIKEIIELKEKMFQLLGTRGGNEQYNQEGLEVFTLLAKKLAAIAQKYGTPCMIGTDPFVGRFGPDVDDRSKWLRETFLERTFLDALANALKEVELTPVCCQMYEEHSGDTRVVNEGTKSFNDWKDKEVVDDWEYTEGAEKRGIKRVNQVRIEIDKVTTKIKWYAIQ